MRTPLLAAALLAALLPACATGDAGAGADTLTRSHSAGVLSLERADRVDVRVTLNGYPDGMQGWTPEQITAFVTARGQAGGNVGFGEFFASRQDVDVGADLAGGKVDATNRTDVDTAIDPSAIAKKAAGLEAGEAVVKSLGLADEPPAGGTDEPDGGTDGADPGTDPAGEGPAEDPETGEPE